MGETSEKRQMTGGRSCAANARRLARILTGTSYKGTCIGITPLSVVGRNGTQKGTVILRVPDGNYEQYLPIDFFGKFAECAERAEVGGVYEVRALLKGREWTSPQGVIKYFL